MAIPSATRCFKNLPPIEAAEPVDSSVKDN